MFRNLARVLGLALLWAACSQPLAQAATKPFRVLFIGNDLTYTGEIPERVEKLARALGREATIETVAYPDYGLIDHWKDDRTRAAIRKGWDVVVLQEGPSADAAERAALVEFSKRFAGPIREAGAKPALFMVWPSADRLKDFPLVVAAYRKAAEETNAILLPVGEAWLRALTADKRLRLHGDPVHAGSLGADLAAITIYLTLFPAGPQEFDEAFVEKGARALQLPRERRDPLFDAATRAIDEPMALR